MKGITACVFLFCLWGSCCFGQSKENGVPAQSTEEGRGAMDSIIPEYRAAYVRVKDGNDYVFLGNQREENSFLQWCKKTNINAIILYGSSRVVDSEYNLLGDFIYKARNKYGIVSVSGIFASDVSAHKLMDYNDAQTDVARMMDRMTSEIEFWKSDDNTCYWNCFKSYIEAISSRAKSQGMKINVYLGSDALTGNIDGASPADRAEYLVTHTDAILWYNYNRHSNSPFFDMGLGAHTYDNTTSVLEAAGRKQDRQMPVYTLWDVKQNGYLYNYFRYNSYLAGHYKVYNEFRAAEPSVDHVDIRGFAVFKYPTVP
jgi:hypothetical protein